MGERRSRWFLRESRTGCAEVGQGCAGLRVGCTACPEWQRGLTLYSISVRGEGVDETVSADLATDTAHPMRSEKPL